MLLNYFRDPYHWCVTCNHLAKSSCSSRHTILHMGNSTVTEARRIVKLFDQCKTQRAQVVAGRRQLQDYLDSLLEATEVFKKSVQVVGQENQARYNNNVVSKITSLLRSLVIIRNNQ